MVTALVSLVAVAALAFAALSLIQETVQRMRRTPALVKRQGSQAGQPYGFLGDTLHAHTKTRQSLRATHAELQEIRRTLDSERI